MTTDPQTGEVRLDERGHEIPDPNPVELPLGMKRPETLAEQVQRLVRTSMSAHAAMHGMETFEEAEDLEVDEDFDPYTPYEVEFDPVIGRNVTAADLMDPSKKDAYREAYLTAERNRIRSEEFQANLEEAYQTARKTAARRQSAPSSSAAKPPPAEPSSAE